MLELTGVLETALYVEDLGRSVDFYRTVLRLDPMMADDRFCAFNVPGHQVLLLFKKGASTASIPTSAGPIPPHDGTGQLHMAFSIAASEFDDWERWLKERQITVESKISWPEGGRSLYFRDPDGSLLELATPGIWPNL